MRGTAVGLFVQEVAVFAGQALVAMAAKAGLAVGRTLPAPLLVGVVVARGAAGDTDPVKAMTRKRGDITSDRSQNPFKTMMVSNATAKGPSSVGYSVFLCRVLMQ